MTSIMKIFAKYFPWLKTIIYLIKFSKSYITLNRNMNLSKLNIERLNILLGQGYYLVYISENNNCLFSV